MQPSIQLTDVRIVKFLKPEFNNLFHFLSKPDDKIFYA